MDKIDKLEKTLALKAFDVVPFHSAVVVFAPRNKVVEIIKNHANYNVIFYETRVRYVNKDPSETTEAKSYANALIEAGHFMGIDLEAQC